MAGAADSTIPSLLRLGRGPLVGRGHELTVLAHCLAQARAGRASVVLLAGEPGIGKTRLLEEFPPPELAAGVTVLRGAATQAEGMPPYLPFLEALGEYVLATAAEQLQADLGSNAAILAPLLPEVGARLGALPPPVPLTPEQERLRLYAAVAALLAGIAARGGLILILDDLHWADTATCDLLVHVARRLQAAPLLVVGAYREAEAEENAAFTRTVAELNRHRLLVPLPLRPLHEDESRQLAAGVLRGDLTTEAHRLLHRHGEGNPFYVEELLRGLVEAGALHQGGSGWELGLEPGQLLPAGLVGAIRQRLTRLAPAVVELLQVAAIAGRTFAVDLLTTVTDGESEVVEDHLLTATRARLVRPEAAGGYSFVHAKVREVLATAVPATRRRRLHQAIGAALAAQADATSARDLADLAFHFVQAGDATRGVAYALAAGEQALRAYAPAEAMAHYRAAIDLLTGSDDEARRTAALLGLGDAATLAGDYRQAADSYAAAQAAAGRAGDRAAMARAWRRLGAVRWRQEAIAEARTAFERALELLGPVDSAEAAETLLHLGELLGVSVGEREAALAYGERALAMVERLGDRRLEAAACCTLGSIRTRTNDLTTGRALLERGLMLAREQDDPARAAEACAYLANACYWAGDITRSWEVSRLREELARRTQDPYQLRHVYAWMALLCCGWGDWAQAEQLLAQQEQIVERLESPEPLAYVGMVRGHLHYHQGRFDEAVAEMAVAVDTLRRSGPGTLVWYLGSLGMGLAELDRREETLACLAELEDLSGFLNERSVAGDGSFARLVLAYARLGERERAAAYYRHLLPFAGQFQVLLVDRALGVAAACRGDRAAALRHLADAEALARREGLRPELGLTLLQRGLLEREAAAGAASGEAVIAEGLRLCEELGMQALAHRLLDAWPGDQQRRRVTPRGPDGLSRREMEVLRLVAQGRTNREIAALLALSEGTVANHLTAIFTKTGVDNRAGAVAYALRHGLDE